MNLDLQKVLPAEAFETEQNKGDYIGKDGLLYCGVCRTKSRPGCLHRILPEARR